MRSPSDKPEASPALTGVFFKKRRRGDGSKKRMRRASNVGKEDKAGDRHILTEGRSATGENEEGGKRKVKLRRISEGKVGAAEVKRDKLTGDREEEMAEKEEEKRDERNEDANRERGSVRKRDERIAGPSFGPQGKPKNFKSSIRVDYQPDVCKDYKETGFCGFGDACKFLHDRGDYKSGWQLEKDWQTRQKERREAILRGEDPDAEQEDNAAKDSDELPFACHICRQHFTNPVVTLCQHYFCETCALNRMSTDDTCAVCQRPLHGVLNVAHKLLSKNEANTNLQIG